MKPSNPYHVKDMQPDPDVDYLPSVGGTVVALGMAFAAGLFLGLSLVIFFEL